MMKTITNTTHIEGILYEHDLTAKESGPNSKNPGTPFISGTISIATDDNVTNIVQVHFTYVTATTARGSANATYNTLRNIIDGAIGTYMKDGAEKAALIRVDSAIGLNEFYSDRNGKEELVSTKRNEGGFVHIINNPAELVAEDQRNTFKCDMIITNVSHIDANEERNLPEKVIVRGAIFDFRKALLPVEFSATSEGAMAYYEGLGASNSEPVFTKVWGRQISEVIKRVEREESAFGDDSVREVQSTRKDFVITGGAKEPYPWDDENFITAAELNQAMTERQTYLATIKQRQDEYKASRQSNIATPAAGGFNF